MTEIKVTQTDNGGLEGRAAQTPLIELLRAIPADYRAQWDDGGGFQGAHYAPVGRHCHEAADHIASLEHRLSEAERALEESDLAACERAIARMGWPEIHAFQAECREGQDVREDAGGYLLRCIAALFGVRRRDPVTTYQDAARAMVTEARSALSQQDTRHG